MLWVALLTGLYCYLEAKFIRLRSDTVVVENLPEGFEGLRIIHLSDLHCSGFGAQEKRLCRILRQVEGDLAVFTGDFKHRKSTDEERAGAAVRQIVKDVRARFGAVGVMGNKDSSEMSEEVERAGIEILSGKTKRLACGKEAVWIAGIDCVRVEENTRAVISVTNKMPEGEFKILLSHRPDVMPLARALGYALVLSGDTHGGQIRLPLVGAPKVKSRVSRRYLRGIIREGGTVLCVSTGIGTCAVPLRLLSPPEVRVLTLRRQQQDKRLESDE
jgi:predicted MPP superfamily phosphohydrolase